MGLGVYAPIFSVLETLRQEDDKLGISLGYIKRLGIRSLRGGKLKGKEEKRKNRGWDVAQLMEYLPCMHEALGSNPSCG